MARELPHDLEPPPPLADFAPGITGLSSEGMVELEPGRPKSLPPVPQPDDIAPPPVAYGGYPGPLTFSSVSSLLNPVPRQDVEALQTYQLYDTPVPVAHPPVQRAFERVSRAGSGGFGLGRGSISFSGYSAPTPVYERFARGGRDAPSPPRSTPSPPFTPNRPRRKEGDFVPWHARDEHGVRRAKTQHEREPTPAREPSDAQTLPGRPRPPRIEPGTLPNPNTHRPSRK
ncbi:hypothetical protein FRC08_014777 [Ceratobasidium sp. 394]|nr:hypothetical protein FRC08_014777 [Ceratobasidium sp. 394]